MSNDTHRTSDTVRDHKIEELRSVLSYIKEYERASVGTEEAVWEGREVEISWRLEFQYPSLTFRPYVAVGDRGDGDDFSVIGLDGPSLSTRASYLRLVGRVRDVLASPVSLDPRQYGVPIGRWSMVGVIPGLRRTLEDT
jgi:hypothetical protein